MISSLLIMGGLGVVIGIGLAVASRIFYVYVDPKIIAIEEALPGANCGGCGLPGCAANAEAIVSGKAAPNSCVAGGSVLPTTTIVASGWRDRDRAAEWRLGARRCRSRRPGLAPRYQCASRPYSLQGRDSLADVA